MTFRVNGLGAGYRKLQAEAARLRAFAVNTQATMAAGNVSGNAIIQALATLTGSIAVFDAVAALPGIVAYAKTEENDPAYDVVVEYTAMRAEAAGCRDWILTNFPTSASGEILKDTLEADGSITVRQFNNSQTAGLQNALGLLIATIDAV